MQTAQPKTAAHPLIPNHCITVNELPISRFNDFPNQLFDLKEFHVGYASHARAVVGANRQKKRGAASERGR